MKYLTSLFFMALRSTSIPWKKIDLHKCILLKRPVCDSLVSLVLPGVPREYLAMSGNSFGHSQGGTTNILWVEAWDASENPTMPRTTPSPPLQWAPGVHPHLNGAVRSSGLNITIYCTTVNSEYRRTLVSSRQPHYPTCSMRSWWIISDTQILRWAGTHHVFTPAAEEAL